MYVSESIYHRLLNQLKFTQLELVVSSFICVVPLVSHVLINARTSVDEVGYLESLIGPTFNSYVSMIITFFTENIATANAVTLFVWALIGSFVYIAFWLLHSVLAGANYSFQSTFKYVHPADFHPVTFYTYALLERELFVISVFGIIFIGTQFGNIIFPWANEKMRYFIQNFSLISIVEILITIIVMVLFVHSIFVLLRLAFGRYHHNRHD